MPGTKDKQYQRQYELFADWLLMSRRTREINGLPKSQAEFARRHGMTARTLSRWKDEDEFQQLLKFKERQQELEGGAERSLSDAKKTGPRRPASEDIDPALLSSSDETDLGLIKKRIVKDAADGSKEALTLWMKYWGGPLVEAERTETDRLTTLSDFDLAVETVRLLGPEMVAEALAELSSRR